MDRGNDGLLGKIIFNKYKPTKQLGAGSFGKIFIGENIKDKTEYALKIEDKDCGQSLLETEAYILCFLKGPGIPAVKSFGFSGEHNVLVMELLGDSLESLFQQQHKKFSIKTTCMVGIQMIERIEWVHNKCIIHRDIKPDNFVIGRGDTSHIVYILDFGLSKKYWSVHSKSHIKFTNSKKLTGTARYASINALNGCEQSRRDDLEAIGYVLMYFLKGSLPWQGLKMDRKDDRYRRIYEKKKETKAETLCEGFPREFCEYINYTRNLEFEQTPDYEFLKGLLKKVMSDNTFEFDYFYDWCKTKPVIKKNVKSSITNEQPEGINHGNIEQKVNDIKESKGGYKALNTDAANLDADIDTNNDNNKGDKKDKKDKKDKTKDKDKGKDKDKDNKEKDKKKKCIIF